jgi:hypothetical protein
MSKWNYQAMGEVGLTGWRRQAAQPVARLIARRTGWTESEIFSFIGAGFLMITLIDFLRTVDDVIAAGRAGPRPRAQKARVRRRPFGRGYALWSAQVSKARHDKQGHLAYLRGRYYGLVVAFVPAGTNASAAKEADLAGYQEPAPLPPLMTHPSMGRDRSQTPSTASRRPDLTGALLSFHDLPAISPVPGLP